jgi:hypothetical protein
MADKYRKDKVRGFYYDHQIMNPLYTVTLHPNTRPKSFDDWSNDLVDGKDLIIDNIRSAASSTGTDPQKQHYDKAWDRFFTLGYSEDPSNHLDGYLPVISGGNTWRRYYAEPICSSIFQEDFSFNINNEWSSWDGGNAIEGIYNSIRQWAPLIGTGAKALKEGVSSMNGDNFGADIVRGITPYVDKLANFAGDAAKTFNKALYIQGTRYSMYNGTSTDFGGSMTMKFTLLSDWKEWYPGENQYHFVSVYDQLNMIYPYAVGFFERHHGGIGWAAEDIKGGEFKQSVDHFMNEYVGWQNPPGGFEAIDRNIDVVQKGTLRLVLGGYYTIDNLVIKNFQVNVSRQLCKNPNKNGRMVPMYADVTISLTPASVYTDKKLGQFLNNSGMQAIQVALERVQKEGNSGTGSGSGNNGKNNKSK